MRKVFLTIVTNPSARKKERGDKCPIISETGLKTKRGENFCNMFCRGKQLKNAEPKGNVGNKHKHMVHMLKKNITMKFYEDAQLCVKRNANVISHISEGQKL